MRSSDANEEAVQFHVILITLAEQFYRLLNTINFIILKIPSNRANRIKKSLTLESESHNFHFGQITGYVCHD